MKARTSIGFDIGNVAAHCVVKEGVPSIVKPWTWTKGPVPERWATWHSHCVDAIKPHVGSNLVVGYEEQIFAGGIKATDTLKAYMTILELVCAQLGVECHGIVPTKLKKVATGNGKAGKDDMKTFLRLWCKMGNVGFNEDMDEHMVDATWVAIWAYKHVK